MLNAIQPSKFNIANYPFHVIEKLKIKFFFSFTQHAGGRKFSKKKRFAPNK